MNISTISYWFYDAINSMKKNKKNILISIGTMVTTMIIIAVAFAVIKNASYIIEQRRKMESVIVAFAVADLTEEQRQGIESQLKNMKEVTEYKYISPEEGYQSAISVEPTLPDGVPEETLANAFPACFSISFSEIEHEDIIIEKLKTMDGIGKSASDIREADTAKDAIRQAKIYQILCTVLLMFIIELSVFLIINSTKLMLYAKRKEISIMKYVGATDGFIKVPFIIESVIVSIIAVIVTLILFSLVYTPIIGTITYKFNFLTCNEILSSLTWILLLIGIGVGVVGSSISMNKYLDV